MCHHALLVSMTITDKDYQRPAGRDLGVCANAWWPRRICLRRTPLPNPSETIGMAYAEANFIPLAARWLVQSKAVDRFDPLGLCEVRDVAPLVHHAENARVMMQPTEIAPSACNRL